MATAKARLPRTRRSSCRSCCCRRIPTTTRTSSSKSAPAPAATNRRCSPATCSACIRATPSASAGRSKSFRPANPTSAATRKSSAASSATAPIRSSSSSRAATACSACRKPRRRAASTPRRAPSRCMPEADEVERRQHQSGRPAHRHLPRLRRRRPAHQQDRLGGAHHPPADRHRRRMPGRPLAAPQQGAGDEVLAARIKDAQEREQQAADRQHAQEPDRQRRPLRAHPHLQLPAGPRHRPPHQPDALQDRRRSWTAISTNWSAR